MKHIPIFMVIAFFGVTAVFLLGGFSAGSAAVFGIVLLSTTFLLGAIAVRVMGETSIEPVSGTSFIVLLLLLSVFLGAQDLLGLTKETAIMLGLVGVTVFGSAITMSGSVIDDYKNSLYIGRDPYHISKGNIVGVIPGTIIGAGIAIYLSIELANGTIDLDAPQANAFATFSIIVANGQGDLMLLGLGFLLGCFVEWATGMGTSFGLGMYLNLGYTLPMLIGGEARDRWERTVLDPKISEIATEEGDVAGAQKQRALILLTTFMIAAGLTVGEAFFGTLSTVFLTIDNVVADPRASVGSGFGSACSSASSQHWPEGSRCSSNVLGSSVDQSPQRLERGQGSSHLVRLRSLDRRRLLCRIVAGIDGCHPTLVEGLLASPGDRPRAGPWIRDPMARRGAGDPCEVPPASSSGLDGGIGWIPGIAFRALGRIH